MTEGPEKKEKSSPQKERELFDFRVPEARDVDIIIFKDEDGVIRARTSEEVELVEGASKGKKK